MKFRKLTALHNFEGGQINDKKIVTFKSSINRWKISTFNKLLFYKSSNSINFIIKKGECQMYPKLEYHSIELRKLS